MRQCFIPPSSPYVDVRALSVSIEAGRGHDGIATGRRPKIRTSRPGGGPK